MASTATPPDVAALLSDLRLALKGDVDDGASRRAQYSSDASNYRIAPLAVILPRDEDDVRAAVKAAGRHGVPVTVRGGGTSCAGNAVGPGLVLDFSRYMNRIISIDPESRSAVVQPGVVLSDLQAAAAAHGLRFGPDPSTATRCTLGGMIGNNACGPHGLAYGRTADNVLGLRLLTGDGRVVELGSGKESFDQVVINFEAIFTELFGGGKACLTMTDPDNPLESGVEIEVQPPGKKLQNMNLLSGGEKTMTAIALMFAVLKAKPTPFCILDEVEAALDDANIDRFANYLKNFDETQFALVTHQKVTMEHAASLYGVTMPERGVSKVLSLKLEDNIDL